MHPPSFRIQQRLSDWPECWLEVCCLPCGGRTVNIPVKLLLKRQGDATFSQVLGRLKCTRCKQFAAPVYLCASPHRKGGYGGPSPDWCVELKPVPS